MVDRVIVHLLNSVRTLDTLATNSAQSSHPFRHPTREGDAWNRESSAKLMNSPFRYPYPLL